MADGNPRASNALVLDLMELEVRRMRAAGIPVGEDDYRGLYVPDSEADRLVRHRVAPTPEGPQAELAVAVEEARARLLQFAAECAGPLGVVRDYAGLSAFESAVLLLCLAGESDLGTERLLAYVQDDVSKRRPRLDLVLRLLAPGTDGRASFNARAPLRASRVVTLHDEPGQPHTPLLARYIALDPRIAQHLLGDAAVDERLVSFRRTPTPAPADADGPSEVPDPVRRLAGLPATTLQPPVVALSSGDPRRLDLAACELAAGAGLGLVVFDWAACATALGVETAWVLSTREGALAHAAVVLEGLDHLGSDERAFILRNIESSAAPLLILASTGAFTWPGLMVEVPPLDHEARLRAWKSRLGPAGDDEVLEALAVKFRLSTAEIENAVKAARGTALARDPAAPEISRDDLYAAARSQSTPILSGLATKVTPHYRWGDIVLGDDPLQQLREMCLMVEHRHVVYETWGFERKLALGKGLIALFAGQSGTGKTMAADVIAGALGLDLYKIDLSGVVSKYIGETEKNLGSIFSEAESSNAILFFDEADALFGKRSEVKDAHDRYANIETAYLLQKMEEYSGPVILSTNLKMNLDEAFLRRMHFVVEFPMPEEDDRRRIWHSTLPAEMPVSSDIDFDFLARQFKVSGGNIRNIVLAAAFLAAADGGPVGMSHMILATRREFQKLGRMVTEADFGSHIALLRPTPR